MCGCGTTTWCLGGCPCGCKHGTRDGARRQGEYFALQYREMSERASTAFDRGADYERKRIAEMLEELRTQVSFGKKPGFRQGFIQCWSLVKDRVAPRSPASPAPSTPE